MGCEGSLTGLHSLMGLKPRAPRLPSLRVADVPPGWGMGRTKLLAKPWSGDIVVSTLSLSTFRQRGDLIVSAVGELDAETAWQLNTALRKQAPWLERVILDLRHVIRIDGVGIGAIVTADAQTREEGQELIVVRPPADVERWLWLTHRDEHVRVVADLPGVIGTRPK